MCHRLRIRRGPRGRARRRLEGVKVHGERPRELARWPDLLVVRVEDLRLLPDRERGRPDVLDGPGLREHRLVFQPPQIGDRDRILVVVLGDIRAARTPGVHSPEQIRVDEGVRGLVVRGSKRPVVEGPSRRSSRRGPARIDARVTHRAGDPERGLAVDVREEAHPRVHGGLVRPHAQALGDRAVLERPAKRDLRPERIALEHVLTELDPLRHGGGASAVPERRGSLRDRELALRAQIRRHRGGDRDRLRVPRREQVPAFGLQRVRVEALARVRVLRIGERVEQRRAAEVGAVEIQRGLRQHASLRPAIGGWRGDGPR